MIAPEVESYLAWCTSIPSHYPLLTPVDIYSQSEQFMIPLCQPFC